jgi:cation diffusion facilitator CzcD-associated flavoprotein CzcO
MSREHVDVLIVGAGLSGVGAAVHLQRRRPGTTYAILEAREAIGGTWDLFRYPGIRSDSDMYTLGYAFRPWTAEKSIADGADILEYIRTTARGRGVDRHIRFHHRVVRASWSTADARWTVEAERSDTGETVTLTAGFLYSCTGYYRYDEGYTPDFPGVDRFGGRIVHPQQWTDDVAYAGKRLVVIGSGATAVTLIPSLADAAEHVTMLQRSPSYILSLPARDPIARAAHRVLRADLAYRVIRWKNVTMATLFFQLSRRAPRVAKALIRRGNVRELPPGFDIDTHLRPTYDPWDQRVCLVPDGDLFRVLREGSASIVTDRIDTFTETGIRLASGAELPADVVVTATGLNVLALGGMELVVDDRPVVLSETVGYKGTMLSDVPNFAVTFGYTNASWTLKADLVAEYVCRLLEHMERGGYRQVTARYREPTPATVPFIDLTSGYVQRAIHHFPRQGDRTPWRLHQNYVRDIAMLRRAPIQDDAIEFSGRRVTA